MSHTPEHDDTGQSGDEVNAPPAAPAQTERPYRRSPLSTAWYAANRAAMLSPDAAADPNTPPALSSTDGLMPAPPTWHKRSQESISDEERVVPAYKLHPTDMYLIREAADRMNLSVADYAQIAPFLYAKCMVEYGW